MSILRYDNPMAQDQRGDISLAEAVADAALRAETELADDPALLADLLRNIAIIETAKLDFASAERRLQSALDWLEREPRPTSASETFEGRILLDFAALRFGQGRQPEALPLLDRALPLLERSGEPELLVDALLARGGVAGFVGDMPGSLEHYTRALEVQRQFLAPDDARLAEGLWYLSDRLVIVGRAAEARPLLDEAEALLLATQGERSPLLVQIVRTLARVEQAEGKTEARADQLLRAHQLAEANLPVTHPWRALLLLDLGMLEASRGDLRAAEDWLLRSVDAYRSVPGRSAIRPQTQLASVYTRHGQFAQANKVLAEPLQHCTDAEYRASEECHHVLYAELRLQIAAGELDRAEASLMALNALLGPTPILPRQIQIDAARIALLHARDRTEEARELQRNALAALGDAPEVQTFRVSLQQACEPCLQPAPP